MKPLNKAEIVGIIATLLLIAVVPHNPDPLAVRHAKEASYVEVQRRTTAQLGGGIT